MPLAPKVFDWKKAIQPFVKPPQQWHFKFSAAKRFIIRRTDAKEIVIRGEPNYCVDVGAEKPIVKKTKRLGDVNLDDKSIPAVHNINPLKLRDVDCLLKKHFGEQWTSNPGLEYYSASLQSQHEEHKQEERHSNNEDSNENTFV